MITLCNSFKSGKVFVLRKKIVRIMDGARTRTLRRRLFKHLENPLVLYIYLYILEQNNIYIYITATDNEVHYDRLYICIYINHFIIRVYIYIFSH